MEWQIEWQKKDKVEIVLETAMTKFDSESKENYKAVRLTMNSGAIGVVIIMQDKNKRIAIVQQFRPVLGKRVWELPRGMGELSDTNAIEAAYREAREELGIQGTNARILGTFYPDSGILANPVAVVYMIAGNSTDNKDNEIDNIKWLTLEEIKKGINSGKYTDGFMVAALGMMECMVS